MSPASTINLLRSRAEMLQKARNFFAERNILEVDPCALMKCPPNDANIDVIATDEGFLHTSPEYAMKRLLSQGVGDCYFLGHVYRKGESGPLHNPEFTMAEWYRVGFSLDEMIQETADFLSLFLGPLPVRTLSYRNAFETFLQIDYTDLASLHRHTPHPWPKETCLHYLISHKIEPHLGQGELTALIDFPPDQAALACVVEKEGELVAERFEIYYRGIELTNGYHELADAEEVRRRFEEKNKERIEPYPIDEEFLASLQTLPDCCGVAVGFDRALMLHHNLSSIHLNF